MHTTNRAMTGVRTHTLVGPSVSMSNPYTRYTLYIVIHAQCWAPKPIWGSVGYLPADRRKFSVFGYLKAVSYTHLTLPTKRIV